MRFIKPKEPENEFGASIMTKPPVNISLVKFFHCESRKMRFFMDEDSCVSTPKRVYVISFLYTDGDSVEWRFNDEKERDACYIRTLEENVRAI